jgi:hypothetical protein
MSWDDNPYYNPEKHGLVKVAEADLSEPDYSFDLLVAWRDDEGYYLGTDSGCSCPTPFEDYVGRADMTGPLTADQARKESMSLKKNSYQPGYDTEAFEQFLKEIK